VDVLVGHLACLACLGVAGTLVAGLRIERLLLK